MERDDQEADKVLFFDFSTGRNGTGGEGIAVLTALGHDEAAFLGK
jgi:hypothetical protein